MCLLYGVHRATIFCSLHAFEAFTSSAIRAYGFSQEVVVWSVDAEPAFFVVIPEGNLLAYHRSYTCKECLTLR